MVSDANKYKAQVQKFLATLDDGKYADDAREILQDFGVFTYPEMERQVARQRALDKLTQDDIEALGLNIAETGVGGNG